LNIFKTYCTSRLDLLVHKNLKSLFNWVIAWKGITTCGATSITSNSTNTSKFSLGIHPIICCIIWTWCHIRNLTEPCLRTAPFSVRILRMLQGVDCWNSTTYVYRVISVSFSQICNRSAGPQAKTDPDNVVICGYIMFWSIILYIQMIQNHSRLSKLAKHVGVYPPTFWCRFDPCRLQGNFYDKLFKIN